MAGDIGAVVPAAGQSQRFGGGSKLLTPLAGRPLIEHTLRALEGIASIGWIVIAARPEDRGDLEALCRSAGAKKVREIVDGGDTRAASVANGVRALPAAALWALVHDAARPCVTAALIEAVIEQARVDGAAICGLPAWLTVKAVDQDRLVRLTLDREGLWFMQTPQVFCREWFHAALSLAADAESSGRQTPPGHLPDDAALLEWAGYRVRVMPGDPWNIKVTTLEDVVLAEAILAAQRQRAGGRPASTARRQRAPRAAGPRRTSSASRR